MHITHVMIGSIEESILFSHIKFDVWSLQASFQERHEHMANLVQ